MPLAPSSAVSLEKNSGYIPEILAEYIVGTIIIFTRWAVRIRTVGFRGFQGDDYLMALAGFRSRAVLLYTTDFSMCYLAYYTGGNIDVKPSQVDSLSDEDIRILTLGSKLEWVTWHSYPSFIWTLKFAILFFYKRLNLGVFREKFLNFLFWFCGLTYITLIITISTTCRPYSANWQIRPLPGFQCIFRAQNFIALAVLNITTDLAILTIPLPMLWQLRVPLTKKIIITLLLCSGLFVISAAIVRAAITLGTAPSVLTVNFWGFRETVVALFAVSAPVLSPLCRSGFWRRGPYLGAHIADGSAEKRRRKKLHGVQGSSSMSSGTRMSKRWPRRRGPPFGNWLGTFELRKLTLFTTRTDKSMVDATAAVIPGDESQMERGEIVVNGDLHDARPGQPNRGLDFITGNEFLVDEDGKELHGEESRGSGDIDSGFAVEASGTVWQAPASSELSQEAASELVMSPLQGSDVGSAAEPARPNGNDSDVAALQAKSGW